MEDSCAMARSYVFEKITQEDCVKLRAAEGEGIRACLERAASRSDHGDPWLHSAGSTGRLHEDPSVDSQSLRDIELDLLFHAAVFAKERRFGDEQMSAFLSVLWRTHRDSMERRLSMEKSFALFQENVVAHAVHRPPRSVQIFSLGEVRDIEAYVVGTYYRSYKLYQYCFTPPAIANVEDAMHPEAGFYPPWGPQPPRIFRPLQESLSLEDWEKREEEKLAAQRAAAAAQAEAEGQQETEEERLERERAEQAAAAEPSPVDALPQPAGLKAQLENVANEVTKMSLTQLEALEKELDSLDGRLTEAKEAKGAKGKKK